MKKIKFHEAILLVLITLALFVWLAVFKLRVDKADIYFFDVGQGDSAMVVAPGNVEILIDGGPDNKVLSEIGKVMPFYDRKIELIILTHPHEDHLSGLIDVLKRYEVEEIWETKITSEGETYKKWQEIIKEKNIPDIAIWSGRMKSFGNLKIETLAPLENLDGKNIENLNNSSIVNKVTFKNKTFLFTGDIEEGAQQDLVNSGQDLKSDILKQPHHGSEKFLSSFLNKVSPQYVVVSCGLNNKFNFPNFKTLDKIKNAELFRTDLDKTLKFSIKNNELIFNTGL